MENQNQDSLLVKDRENNQHVAPKQDGYYSNNDVPDEIKGWNWGAFALNIIWGIANKSYLTLLCLIPLFNIVWCFVCGAKGNEWAWRNSEVKDIAQFKAIQKTWNRAGIFEFIIFTIIICLYFLVAVIIGTAVSNSGYQYY